MTTDPNLVEFLRARYAEARAAEHGKRRVIPSPFDGRDVVWESNGIEGPRLLVDGHPYPVEEYREVATEAAPDPVTLADLDAKREVLEQYEAMLERRAALAANGMHHSHADAAIEAYEHVLRVLARPYAGHPDHRKGWAP